MSKLAHSTMRKGTYYFLTLHSNAKRMITKKREDRRLRPPRRGWLALMPLVLLAILMAGMGWLMGDFSSVPMTIVF